MIQPDKIIRSNRKTLSIIIDSRGALIVRAPRVYPLERIWAFIERKEKWINEKRSALKTAPYLPPEEGLDGYAFPLLGKTVEICLYDGGRVALNEQTGVLFVPQKDAEKRVKNWLKAFAKKQIEPIVKKRSLEMNLPYESISITSAKTRWGSCSGKGKLHFSYRLIYCPEEIVDYVVVHELAHIPFKNHGTFFWKKVESVYPNYKAKRKYLKQSGFLMSIF